MIEQFLLGTIQGIVEWLPVSSEGTLLLANEMLLKNSLSFEAAVRMALFLHFGTFLAALVYFRKDVGKLLKALLRFPQASKENQNIITFLIITTMISGVLGLTLIKCVEHLATDFAMNGRSITLLIGILLLGTAFLELRAKRSGYRNAPDINWWDGILLGIAQGFAALPGFSRSGLTVSALLLRKFDKTIALKLSFLMSLPIVLAGNIVMHFKDMHITKESLIGLAASFVFGLATIHILLKVAEKVNFGYFVLFFGLLTIAASLI